jgi:predicted AAA+ superfamily ATPase
MAQTSVPTLFVKREYCMRHDIANSADKVKKANTEENLERSLPNVLLAVILRGKMTTMNTKYLKRIFQAPAQSFFLFGPRGTGKTTCIKHQFEHIHSINLLDESLYQSYLGNISLFAAELRALAPGSWVFVDEIQRIPNLLNEVHRFMEEKQLKFILTGSSARKLKSKGVNLLAGRALFKKMYPFLPEELGSAFNLDDALTYGSIPLVWDSPDKKETLKAYVQMYLKEEIQGEAAVRNLPGFARFLPVAATMHGQLINVASASREVGIARTTLSDYLEILEDTLLVFKLRAFENKLRYRERKHAKLYWVDPGLVRAINNRFSELGPEEKGAVFEGFIAGLLKAYQEYRGLFDEFYYWAPASSQKLEVDFLLKKDKEFIALEIKSSVKVHKEHLKGLKAIAELKGLKKRILVYTGDKKMRSEDGIDIWPFSFFNQVLIENSLWR